MDMNDMPNSGLNEAELHLLMSASGCASDQGAITILSTSSSIENKMNSASDLSFKQLNRLVKDSSPSDPMMLSDLNSTHSKLGQSADECQPLAAIETSGKGDQKISNHKSGTALVNLPFCALAVVPSNTPTHVEKKIKKASKSRANKTTSSTNTESRTTNQSSALSSKNTRKSKEKAYKQAPLNNHLSAKENASGCSTSKSKVKYASKSSTDLIQPDKDEKWKQVDPKCLEDQEQELLDKSNKEKEEENMLAVEAREKHSKALEERLKAEEQERQIIEEAIRVDLEERQQKLKLREIRECNLKANCARPDALYFKELNSTITKNTAFVRKLSKKLTEHQKDSLIRELRSLNLTKYVSEAVTNIANASFKSTDISAVVSICSELHQLYAEFSSELVPVLLKNLNPEKNDLIRRKAMIRLLVELFIAGVYTQESVLNTIFKDIFENKTQKFTMVMQLALTFIKSCGPEILGIHPRSYLTKSKEYKKIYLNIKDQLPLNSTITETPKITTVYSETESIILDHELSCNTRDLPPSEMMVDSLSPSPTLDYSLPPFDPDELFMPVVIDHVCSKEFQQTMLSCLNHQFNKLVRALLRDHNEICKVEQINKEIIQNRLELSDEVKHEYAKSLEQFNSYFKVLSTIADLLNRDLPEVLQEDHMARMKLIIPEKLAVLESDTSQGPWEDEETLQFYEKMPDLKYLVALKNGTFDPCCELKDAGHDFSTQDISGNGHLNEPNVDTICHTNHVESMSTNVKKFEENEDHYVQLGIQPGSHALTTIEPSFKEIASGSQSIGLSLVSFPTTHNMNCSPEMLQLFFNRISNCSNTNLIDQAAAEFYQFNQKSWRARLAHFMFNSPRNRLDILHYYARMVAILNPYIKEVGAILLRKLEEEFEMLYRQKDQMNIESKIKNIHFLSELAKFRICPSSTIFNFFKMCLDDFRHHNIDIVCEIMETCGRFLYCTPENHLRMRIYIDNVIQQKNTRALPSRTEVMIENAISVSKPPEKSSQITKVVPPVHQYIQKLIYEVLHKNTVKFVVLQLRKLDWHLHERYLLKLIMSNKNTYLQLELIVNVLLGLKEYHEAFVIKVIDQLLEDIRLSLDEQTASFHQKLILNIKMLSNLYNAHLVDNTTIIGVLYTLITYGLSTNLERKPVQHSKSSNLSHSNNSFPTPYSSYKDSFRARIVCTFVIGSQSLLKRHVMIKDLVIFFLYFQHFLFLQIYISRDLQFMIDEMFELLASDIVQYSTHDQVIEQLTMAGFLASPITIGNLKRLDLQLSLPYPVQTLLGYHSIREIPKHKTLVVDQGVLELNLSDNTHSKVKHDKNDDIQPSQGLEEQDKGYGIELSKAANGHPLEISSDVYLPTMPIPFSNYNPTHYTAKISNYTTNTDKAAEDEIIALFDEMMNESSVNRTDDY